MKPIATLSIILILLSMVACDENRVFEKYTEISNYSWGWDNTIPFEVEINDTNIFYNVYINVRHNVNYEFRNLWILIHHTFPSGKKFDKRIELTLADKEGKWYGTCMSDICDRQVSQGNTYFPEIGTYHFEFEHNMRKNPLPHIMEVGLRIEKTDKTRD